MNRENILVFLSLLSGKLNFQIKEGEGTSVFVFSNHNKDKIVGLDFTDKSMSMVTDSDKGREIVSFVDKPESYVVRAVLETLMSCDKKLGSKVTELFSDLGYPKSVRSAIMYPIGVTKAGALYSDKFGNKFLHQGEHPQVSLYVWSKMYATGTEHEFLLNDNLKKVVFDNDKHLVAELEYTLDGKTKMGEDEVLRSRLSHRYNMLSIGSAMDMGIAYKTFLFSEIGGSYGEDVEFFGGQALDMDDYRIKEYVADFLGKGDEFVAKTDMAMLREIVFDDVDKRNTQREEMREVMFDVEVSRMGIPQSKKSVRRGRGIKSSINVELQNRFNAVAGSGDIDELTRYLSDGIVDLSYTDDNGDSVLHWVARGGSLESASAIVNSAGGSLVYLLDGKNGDGKTPLDLARQYGHSDMEAYLVDLGTSSVGDIVNKLLPKYIENAQVEIDDKLYSYRYLIEKSLYDHAMFTKISNSKKALKYFEIYNALKSVGSVGTIKQGDFKLPDFNLSYLQSIKVSTKNEYGKCVANVDVCRVGIDGKVVKSSVTKKFGEDIYSQLVGYGVETDDVLKNEFSLAGVVGDAVIERVVSSMDTVLGLLGIQSRSALFNAEKFDLELYNSGSVAGSELAISHLKDSDLSIGAGGKVLLEGKELDASDWFNTSIEGVSDVSDDFRRGIVDGFTSWLADNLPALYVSESNGLFIAEGYEGDKLENSKKSVRRGRGIKGSVGLSDEELAWGVKVLEAVPDELKELVKAYQDTGLWHGSDYQHNQYLKIARELRGYGNSDINNSISFIKSAAQYDTKQKTWKAKVDIYSRIELGKSQFIRSFIFDIRDADFDKFLTAFNIKSCDGSKQAFYQGGIDILSADNSAELNTALYHATRVMSYLHKNVSKLVSYNESKAIKSGKSDSFVMSFLADDIVQGKVIGDATLFSGRGVMQESVSLKEFVSIVDDIYVGGILDTDRVSVYSDNKRVNSRFLQMYKSGTFLGSGEAYLEGKEINYLVCSKDGKQIQLESAYKIGNKKFAIKSFDAFEYIDRVMAGVPGFPEIEMILASRDIFSVKAGKKSLNSKRRSLKNADGENDPYVWGEYDGEEYVVIDEPGIDSEDYVTDGGERYVYAEESWLSDLLQLQRSTGDVITNLDFNDEGVESRYIEGFYEGVKKAIAFLVGVSVDKISLSSGGYFMVGQGGGGTYNSKKHNLSKPKTKLNSNRVSQKRFFDTRRRSVKSVRDPRLLLFAVLTGDIDEVERLVEVGEDIYSTSLDHGNNLLWDAVSEGHFDIADYLISEGVEVNIEGNYLHYFVSLQDLEAIKYLVDKGVDVNKVGDRFEHETPLTWGRNKKEISDYLKSVGAKTNEELGIERAVQFSRKSVKSADIEDIEGLRHPIELIDIVARTGDMDALIVLLDEGGVNVNVVDKEGRTALDWVGDDKEMADYLRSRGAKTSDELVGSRKHLVKRSLKSAELKELKGKIAGIVGNIREGVFEEFMPDGSFWSVEVTPSDSPFDSLDAGKLAGLPDDTKNAIADSLESNIDSFDGTLLDGSVAGYNWEFLYFDAEEQSAWETKIGEQDIALRKEGYVFDSVKRKATKDIKRTTSSKRRFTKSSIGFSVGQSVITPKGRAVVKSEYKDSRGIFYYKTTKGVFRSNLIKSDDDFHDGFADGLTYAIGGVDISVVGDKIYDSGTLWDGSGKSDSYIRGFTKGVRRGITNNKHGESR